jgi:hypothetical protein
VTVSFASGMNLGDVASWAEEAEARCSKPMWYERDGKNWDATMRLEHFVYKIPYYAILPGLLGFALDCLVVDGIVVKGGHVLRYKLDGTVKSGHNDTTLGNSIVNAGIAASALVTLGLRGHIIVAGDDLLAVIDGDYDLTKLMEAEARLGIIPKATKHDDITSASFISACFWRIRGRILCTPKPGRLLAKLFWTVKPPSKARERDYVHSICVGVRSMVGGMVVIDAWLRACDKGGVELDWVKREKRFLEAAGPFCIRPTRDEWIGAWCLRYGLDATRVCALERFMESCDKPGLLCHDTVDLIIRTDTDDFYRR